MHTLFGDPLADDNRRTTGDARFTTSVPLSFLLLSDLRLAELMYERIYENDEETSFVRRAISPPGDTQ